MADHLVPLETSYGGGLNVVDSPDELAPTEARTFRNFRVDGVGRITPRKAGKTISTSVTGEPIAVFPFSRSTTAGILLTWDSGAQVVKLYTLTGSGAPALVGNLAGWTGVSSQPRISGASLAGVMFFVDEGKNFGMTCYDPGDFFGSGSTLFRPTFDFDEDTVFGALRARLLVEHHNHLWAFGYGDETIADMGHIAHFSYPGFDTGLDEANIDAGDAGVNGAFGSETMFDLSDAVPIGSAGVPIVSAMSGNGRMVVATAHRAGVLMGTDRDTWRFQWFDTERGSPTTRGMVEANGIIYWLSSLGDMARFGGAGEPDIFSRKIGPRIEQMNLVTMFAAHAIEECQVRWYYALLSDTDPTPDRWIGWDYKNQLWLEDTLGYRCNAAGWIRPAGSEAPTAAPSSLTHDEITTNTARARWTNGDTSIGATTRVYRAPDAAGGSVATAAGSYTLQDTLASGDGDYTHTGLEVEKAYWTKVEHVRNGQVSASLEGSFVTLPVGTVPPPLNVQAEGSPVWNEKYNRWDASMLIWWNLADTTLRVELHRSLVSGFTPDATTLRGTTSPGETSIRDGGTMGVTYYFKIRTLDAAGNYSSFAAEVSATPDPPLA